MTKIKFWIRWTLILAFVLVVTLSLTQLYINFLEDAAR
jgi:hypothetical protein